MGQITDAKIAEWQRYAGIEPARGRKLELLDRMQQEALALIRIVELEKSGIREGDGFWYGSDPLCSITKRFPELYREYEASTSATVVPTDWGEVMETMENGTQKRRAELKTGDIIVDHSAVCVVDKVDEKNGTLFLHHHFADDEITF